MRVSTEYAIWQAELARPKLTIPQRVALWVGPPARETPAELTVKHDPDMFTWRNPAELWERDK